MYGIGPTEGPGGLRNKGRLSVQPCGGPRRCVCREGVGRSQCASASFSRQSARARTRASANGNGYRECRFAFFAAFRCAFAYFFIAFRCFLEAFFNLLFCCLADFLSNSVELRAYSATPGLCALAGINHAPCMAASSTKTENRFTQIFLFDFKDRTSLLPLGYSRHCKAIFIESPSLTPQNTRPSWKNHL